MRKHAVIIACGISIALGMTGVAVAQNPQPPSARQELQETNGPRSIDQELDHLTRDLELTTEQQKNVRALACPVICTREVVSVAQLSS